MNILALYVLKISGKVFENQVKMPPLKAERFATSLSMAFSWLSISWGGGTAE